MYQNYGYQQPQVNRPIYQGNLVTVPNLKGRPVSSLEEARASIIDFDGSVFYFPDTGNKRIYTKQINMDGTAQTLIYELVAPAPMPVEQPTKAPDYITRQEFEQAITQLKEGLRSPVSEIAESSQKDPQSGVAQLQLNF